MDFTLTTPFVKTWMATDGLFTETLTKITEVNRGLNQIGFAFEGTVTGGAFTDVPGLDDS